MNKIIVITGADMGIGKCTADMYRSKGDTVLCLSLAKDPEYEDFSYICDVTSEEQVKTAIEDIKEKYGHIDVVVNNAGIGVNGALELLPYNVVRKANAVNVEGVYLVSKYCLPLMSKGGKIINMSSISGVTPSPFRSLYHFTKSAVYMMSLCQRMELDQAGIDVTAICPGEAKTTFVKNRVKVVETNEKYGNRVARSFEKMEKHDNGKRMEPSKIANVIVKQSYKKHSKAVVVVGAKAKVFYIAYKILPLKWFLACANKIMGGGKIN